MSNRTFEALAALLSSLSVLEWGVADISGLHRMSAEYPKALCFLVPYAPTFKEYSEQQYHELLERTGIQVTPLHPRFPAFSSLFRSSTCVFPGEGWIQEP